MNEVTNMRDVSSASYRVTLLAGLIAVALSSPRLEAQCNAGVQRLVNEHRLVVGQAQLEALLARNPRDDAAMNCMGRLLMEKGESGQAIEWLDKAIAVNGKSAQHHMVLGLALRTEASKASMFS